MQWKNSHDRYGVVAMAFHWLTALLILTMLCLGFGREFVSREMAHMMMDWHKSIGITILALVICRLLWRILISRPPDFPLSMLPAEKLLAANGHFLLYAALLTMILTGWGMTSAKGRDISVFGLFTMPPLLAVNKPLGQTLNEIHTWASYGLMALIGLHSIAALYHHYIRRDNVLTRMLP